MCLPIVVLVVVLNGQEGVGEDVYEGHPDGRTQPAARFELSGFLLKTVLFPPRVKETVLQSNLR